MLLFLTYFDHFMVIHFSSKFDIRVRRHRSVTTRRETRSIDYFVISKCSAIEWIVHSLQNFAVKLPLKPIPNLRLSYYSVLV